MSTYKQLFIDCIPGPTYHFGGHSYGNIASMNSAHQQANPKAMALEWVSKIETILKTGALQIILPPHRRPLYGFYKDNDLKKLSSAYTWMANAGHFTPSCDTAYNIPIFTPSNMRQTMHRQKEHYFNRYWFKKIFTDSIIINSPLTHADEGAANTIRLSNNNLDIGLNIYVTSHKNSIFPRRQSKQSINELITNHKIKESFIFTQNKTAMNAGVFHNDVISFGFKNILFCHVESFNDQAKKIDQLKLYYKTIFKHPLTVIEINSISLKDAVDTYLFNSQVIIHNNHHTLVCPSAVKKNKNTHKLVRQWQKNSYFNTILFVPLKQSLMNGGGPACMRLPLILNESEIKQIPNYFMASYKKLNKLKTLITNNYPESFNKQQMNPNQIKTTQNKLETLIRKLILND